MDELVIALDGPSGVGKSSTAKLVAQKLRLAYLDTGAMYRAVACEFARQGLDRNDETGIGELARTADLRMITNPDAPRVYINGRDVTEEIRKPEISAIVSAVAVVPEVRRVLIERMRRIIAEHDRRMVVEGRDITTVVAPDAEVRVLLTADAEARVGRRAAELGERVDQVTVTDSILRRDRDDSTVSNFTEAADGVSVIDSTHLGLDEVVAEILKLVPMREPLDVLVFYVPIPDTDQVLEALFTVGAGHIGNYDSCAFVASGTGRFRPLEGADPTIGKVGDLEMVAENRVEVTFPRSLRATVVAALRRAHPYEEPAFHVVENAAQDC